ncbi:MAG: hypothetical protein H6825_01730 [Planctomycetes bacterium]|nr:hypothetical protein [Planctomycetota bacterium]
MPAERPHDIDRDPLAERLDRALDARRDPFEDEAVLAHLVEHPDDLAEIERLLARLDAIARVEDGRAERERASAPDDGVRLDPRPPRPSRPSRSSATTRRAGVAAAALLVLALGALAYRLVAHPTPDAPRGRAEVARDDTASRAETASRDASFGAPPTSPATRVPEPGGRVLDWRVTTTVRRPDGTQRTIRTPDGTRGDAASTSSASDHPVLIAWSETWPRR